MLSVLLPKNAAVIDNSSIRALNCNQYPALKIFHGTRMFLQNFEVERFSILILLLIPFIFANDGYERNGEPRMESFEDRQSPTRTQRDQSGIIVQNQTIAMKYTTEDVLRK